jgi:hypothetical protein
VAFRYSVPAQPDDDPVPAASACIGDAPPTGWVYNP